MGKLFGTDGVRGIVNRELTPELALRLGLAIGTYFGEGSKILIGRDVRRGGEMLKNAVVAGLIASGTCVYYAGLLPTPALQYEIKNSDFDGGVMITASHNPPMYNGIKVIGGDGIEIPRDGEKKIEEIFFEEKFKRVSWSSLAGEVRVHEGVIDRYVDAIISLVDKDLIREKRYKVVIDAANSVGSLASPLVVKKLGGIPITINGNLDPDFPVREPEPTVDTLKDTAKIVASMGADLGVGHDGDADRSIFIDDKGRAFWGDRSGALLARHIAEKHPDLPRRIFTGVSSSMLVEEYLKKHGIKVEWMKVGSVDISRRLYSERGLCGFEENGGFMYPPHQYVRDGAMTLALMLELMAKTGKKASELFDELPFYHAIKTKVPMTREKALQIVERAKQAYSSYRQITIDGVKIIGEDFWVLMRPSGTEPVLRIMLEATTREKAEDVLRQVLKFIEEAKSK